MPWEITIVNGKPEARAPLGVRDDVIRRVSVALPGAILAPRPPLPLTTIEAMSPLARDILMRPMLEGIFEGDDFVIQFYAADKPTLDSLGCDVRGNGDPIPALTALCKPNGWSVIDDASRSVVTLSAGASSAWERFQRWRDRAIGSLKP